MAVLRDVVFPGLRLVVWTVIAIALCVLAFGSGGSDGPAPGDPLQPVAGIGDSTVPVELGDIASVIELTGTVSADPAATVKSTAAGVVTRVHRKVGDQVGPATPLVDVRVSVETSGGTSVGPDGVPVAAPPVTRSRTVTVPAGSEGVLTTLSVLKDQEVSVGADLATVSPGTLSVSAPLTQDQQFRLLSPPATASAQARGGPAPFVCVDLTTGAAAGAQVGPGGGPPVDPMTGQVLEPSTAQVTCRVPAGTTVFAGMSVELTVDTGSVQQVPVVPVTAVLGSVAEGTVWVVGDDGTSSDRPVKLGLTDGERIQVTEGLAVGDQVLEFAPVDTAGARPGPA
ncbi:MAG TPA: hypothetical protein VM433_15360 [Mycobacteriales bacterium]|nr:hypothetical protein [Mycobacteriales bacterium]